MQTMTKTETMSNVYDMLLANDQKLSFDKRSELFDKIIDLIYQKDKA